MGFDYSRLNIQDADGKWLCPSCGFDAAFSGASFWFGGPLIGTGICPCCMYEPGYDDVTAASGVPEDKPLDALRAYSLKWRDDGMLWRGRASLIPEGWDADAQIENWLKHCQRIFE